MKVVLAGGSGFLGSALTRALLDAGHSVTVLTRSASGARARVDRRAELAEWDAPSAGPWEQALDGAGGAINLAGEPIAGKRWTEAQKERLRASRLPPEPAVSGTGRWSWIVRHQPGASDRLIRPALIAVLAISSLKLIGASNALLLGSTMVSLVAIATVFTLSARRRRLRPSA